MLYWCLCKRDPLCLVFSVIKRGVVLGWKHLSNLKYVFELLSHKFNYMSSIHIHIYLNLITNMNWILAEIKMSTGMTDTATATVCLALKVPSSPLGQVL